MRFSRGFIERMRRSAEDQMTDQFTVQRYTGKTVTDLDTGVDVQEMTQVAESKGKVQTSGGIASQVVAASGDSSNVGGIVPVWSLYIHFPITLTGLREKDVAVCTASGDPDLVGRRFRLVNMQSEKSHATARRWNVQEMPEGD